MNHVLHNIPDQLLPTFTKHLLDTYQQYPSVKSTFKSTKPGIWEQYLLSILKRFSCSGQRAYSQQINGMYNWISHAWPLAYTKTTRTHAPRAYGSGSVFFNSPKAYWDNYVCFPTGSHFAADYFKHVKYTLTAQRW